MKLSKFTKKIYYKYSHFFFKKFVNKNIKFKNKYLGQDCYIIGNGYSLKYFDLKNFSDKISFGCNNLFFHKDFKYLNCKFYITTHSLIYSPIWVNPYSKKISYNLFSKIYLDKINENKNICFFLNLNDIYFTKNLNNTFYLSNFNKKNENYLSDPANVFCNISSSLETMVSLACYFGFKKIFLVGCDYLLNPAMSGRFYETHFNEKIKNFEGDWKKEFLLNASKKIELSIISIDKSFKNKFFEVIEYKNQFNTPPNFNQNNKIVAKDDLLLLKKCKMEYRI
tara:strand:+ start:3321 stop:4163 length:843 start_codon:yes stop_codon:yes gene_type:complete